MQNYNNDGFRMRGKTRRHYFQQNHLPKTLRTTLVQQKTPLEETPLEGTPLEGTPLEGTPLEGTPLEETPLEETPLEETPFEETSLEETLYQPMEDFWKLAPATLPDELCFHYQSSDVHSRVGPLEEEKDFNDPCFCSICRQYPAWKTLDQQISIEDHSTSSSSPLTPSPLETLQVSSFFSFSIEDQPRALRVTELLESYSAETPNKLLEQYSTETPNSILPRSLSPPIKRTPSPLK